MSLMSRKPKRPELGPLYGGPTQNTGDGPPPALGTSTPVKDPGGGGGDGDGPPPALPAVGDDPDEVLAKQFAAAAAPAPAAINTPAPGHKPRLSVDLSSVAAAAVAEEAAAAAAAAGGGGGGGKAQANAERRAASKSPNGTRVTPKAPKSAAFSFEEALQDGLLDAAMGGGGGGGAHPFEAHPFDSVSAGSDTAVRRPRPKKRRSQHRTSVSFSDQPGVLEGSAANSLAAQLRELAQEASGSGDSGSQSAGSKPSSLMQSMLTNLGGGSRRSNSLSSLDLIDLLEGGEARECLSDDVVGTPKVGAEEDTGGGWEHCIVEVDEEKVRFRLFTDATHRFLLSARREGDSFFMSQYYDFPDEFDNQDGEMADRFCAVVRKGMNCYRVWNRGCEICDNELAKYRCSMQDDPSQRQELATVRHCESKIMDRKRIIADARQIMIDIPTLDAELLRQGWCARFPRTPKTSMELASMLPDWNPRIQSLSMKFLHGKVKAASSKNFLVSRVSAMDETHACLQFGKTKSGLFNLSYRNPVAAIQAFGVSLSLYNWLGVSAKENQGKGGKGGK